MSLVENNTEPKLERARHSSESESEREWNEDRLSELPDSLVLHILSFVKCRTAVQTCILSRRWKDLWKQLPSLIFHSTHFRTAKIYSEFVSKALSLRDGSLPLHTLDFMPRGIADPHLLERVVSYGISHNVQRLDIHAICNAGRLPESIFSCETLTSLKLFVYAGHLREARTLLPKSLNLPALATLHLHCFAFCASYVDRAEPFSGCKRLNNLVIERCTLRGAKILCISSATLSSLAIHRPCYSDRYDMVLSTPNLRSFVFEGFPFRLLAGSNLSSVKKVHIHAYMLSPDLDSPSFVLDWLKGLINVKSLTVTAMTLQVLFLIPGLLKIKFPSLRNLKSLKVIVRPIPVNLEPLAATELDGIVNFLVQNSPSAEVVFIEYQR